MILAFIHEREDRKRPSMAALRTARFLRSSMNAKVKKAAIRGRAVRFLRSSLNAKVKKRPSVAALLNFCVRP
jgi:hypothetical protein